jgi:hypothetical protein
MVAQEETAMQSRLATREDAVAIGRQLRKQLPALSKVQDSTTSGRTEYTRAIWNYFDQLRSKYEPPWKLYPETEPKRGKVKGEFLIDFSLFDERLGCRIACESEWEVDVGRIGWAFDKLMAVKADLKILVFQMKYEDGAPRLPNRLEERLVRDALNACGHHHPGHECYLLMQFDHSESRLFFWEPKHSGPYSSGEIEFEFID